MLVGNSRLYLPASKMASDAMMSDRSRGYLPSHVLSAQMHAAVSSLISISIFMALGLLRDADLGGDFLSGSQWAGDGAAVAVFVCETLRVALDDQTWHDEIGCGSHLGLKRVERWRNKRGWRGCGLRELVWHPCAFVWVV